MDTQTTNKFEIGSYVHILEWYGHILDIATGKDHTMFLIESPKQIYRHGRTEWLEYSLNPTAFQRATKEEYEKDAKWYLSRAENSVEKLKALLQEIPNEP